MRSDSIAGESRTCLKTVVRQARSDTHSSSYQLRLHVTAFDESDALCQQELAIPGFALTYVYRMVTAAFAQQFCPAVRATQRDASTRAGSVRKLGGLDAPVVLEGGKAVSGPDLSITVNGLKLPNPFVIGSGPPGM